MNTARKTLKDIAHSALEPSIRAKAEQALATKPEMKRLLRWVTGQIQYHEARLGIYPHDDATGYIDAYSTVKRNIEHQYGYRLDDDEL